MSKYILLFLLYLSATIVAQKTDISNKLTGPYLGQKPPGAVAELFAPGIISKGQQEVCISFTPDGKEVYYTLGGLPYSVILYMKEFNGKWTQPKVAPFSGRYSSECQLSPAGNQMFFCSGIPLTGTGEPKGNWDIWVVEKADGKWNNAERLPSPIASEEYSADCPSVAANGNLYFYSANIPGGFGKGDIYSSKFIDGKYSEPENLGNNINTENYDIDPFIASDESYIIFSSNKPGGSGMNDLYISYRKDDGSWTEAVNMGELINSDAHEIHPFVTRDGKYLFFCSTRRSSYDRYSETPITYEEKMEWLNKPGNGFEDIYWVDAKIIEELRAKQ